MVQLAINMLLSKAIWWRSLFAACSLAGRSAGRARHSVRAVYLIQEACRGLPVLPHRPKARVPLPQIRAKFYPQMYPTKLNKIINLFESLPEDERRETLVSYADNAKKQEPR